MSACQVCGKAVEQILCEGPPQEPITVAEASTKITRTEPPRLFALPCRHPLADGIYEIMIPDQLHPLRASRRATYSISAGGQYMSAVFAEAW